MCMLKKVRSGKNLTYEKKKQVRFRLLSFSNIVSSRIEIENNNIHV